MAKMTDREALQTATRAARARWRKKGTPCAYPTMHAFMTTAQYLSEYERRNALLKPWVFTGTLDREAPKIVGPEVVVEEIDPAHAARLFG
jgi:hypothetical protein